MARTSDSKVKAVVLSHRYSYHEVSGDPSSPLVDVPYTEGTTSTRGVEVEVSQAELERGQAMVPPALAKAGSREAKLTVTADDPYAAYALLSDSDLAAVVAARGDDPEGKSRDELLGLLTA